MSDIPRRETFEAMYERKPPWDIGHAQPVFVAAADRVAGTVLDAGCGTGENALFFAARGHDVLGIDFVESPIEEARRKARARGLSAEFRIWDALNLAELHRLFDSAIDCGLFHVFSDDDRARYVAGLAQVVRPGGKLFLVCFSDEEPGAHGPRRISEQEIRDAFSQGWNVVEIRAARFEVRPDLVDVSFSEGGPKAWFSVIERAAD